ncbi:hypothetical protein [Turicibacter bilis]|uniref:hypothetical protein n=1 Tax=Turicibacter bilis TaxID=2735723 RepID=UPI001BAE7B50|nr:hypothetical protein [Turicibacter bilis]MBS3199012.1 hypothetical protein [Turicibacter bilis]
MCRNPEYQNLTNDTVFKAMNIVEKAKDEKRLSEDEYRLIMPVLDASFDPNEK